MECLIIGSVGRRLGEDKLSQLSEMIQETIKEAKLGGTANYANIAIWGVFAIGIAAVFGGVAIATLIKAIKKVKLKIHEAQINGEDFDVIVAKLPDMISRDVDPLIKGQAE